VVEEEQKSLQSVQKSFSAIWMSKTSTSGRWVFRVSYRLENKEEESKKDGACREEAKWYFALDLFNSECGVFRTLLALPAEVWSEKLDQISDTITSLFHSCHIWDNALVKKEDPSTPTPHTHTRQRQTTPSPLRRKDKPRRHTL